MRNVRESNYIIVSKHALELGIIPAGDRLVAATMARLSSFTSESGEHESSDRPPKVALGLTHTAIFALGKRGFSARGFLELVTHAQQTWAGIQLQWATPRDTAACMSVQNVEDIDYFWSSLKQQRDRIWMGLSRDTQASITWFSGSRPGVNWKNVEGLTLAEYKLRVAPFLHGQPAAHSPSACAFVDSPVDVEESDLTTNAITSSPHARPGTQAPTPPTPRRRTAHKRR